MTSRRATPTRNPIPMTRRLAGVLVAGAVLAGCGSGATEAPGQPSAQPTTPATTRHTTPNPHTDQPEPRYEFTLPEGDRSVSVNEAIAYDDLYHGRCDQIQSFLDGEQAHPAAVVRVVRLAVEERLNLVAPAVVQVVVRDRLDGEPDDPHDGG